ncbi:MAG TPA: response regulator transcription factor [Bryobacteraceae bacterium]|jgi:DNA-binding NarL/FixJ family response regulator
MLKIIRIVIADDHAVVRKGLRGVIEEEPDLKVTGEATDGESAFFLVQELKPEVVVLDLDMPKLDGFAVAGKIRAARLPVQIIFLTIHGELDLLHKALDVGGSGYIVKDSALIDIVNGIRSVAAGRSYVSPSLTPALLERRSAVQALEKAIPGLHTLTVSERRILTLIAMGKPTTVIAAELFIHPRTVETHRGSICHKLQLTGVNSLLRFALEHRSQLMD